MSTKLLAIGNVLMQDDGIAIYLAKSLQAELEELGVEVIYGETDTWYGISQIKDKDRILILDAAKQGKAVGEVSVYSMGEADGCQKQILWHDISIINLLLLYHPNNTCYMITIEADEVGLHYGLSARLKELLPIIRKETYRKIEALLKLSYV